MAIYLLLKPHVFDNIEAAMPSSTYMHHSRCIFWNVNTGFRELISYDILNTHVRHFVPTRTQFRSMKMLSMG